MSLHPPNPSLLGLPLEIRETIYSYVVFPTPILRQELYHQYLLDLALFRTNKQISCEAITVFKREYPVVEILTLEWTKEVRFNQIFPHIRLGKGRPSCESCILRVTLKKEPSSSTTDVHRVLLFLKDLPRFCKVWALCGNATFAGSKLILEIRNNGTEVFAESKLPVSLQEKLLMPFGVLDDKMNLSIPGDYHDQEVEDELRRTIKARKPNAEERLMKENGLMEGNRLKEIEKTALKSGRHEEALYNYFEALEDEFWKIERGSIS